MYTVLAAAMETAVSICRFCMIIQIERRDNILPYLTTALPKQNECSSAPTKPVLLWSKQGRFLCKVWDLYRQMVYENYIHIASPCMVGFLTVHSVETLPTPQISDKVSKACAPLNVSITRQSFQGL